MKDVHKTFLTILLAAIAGSMAAGHYGFIRFADAALTLVFIGVAWFAFGVPWEHRKWSQQNAHAVHRFAPRLYWTMTVLAVAIPVLSLGIGCLITKYAPQRIEGAMAGCMSAPPPEVKVTTLPRTDAPKVSDYVMAGLGSYVAAGTPHAIGIAPATPVLTKVLGDIDSELRIGPVAFAAIILFLLLLILWVVELGLAWREAGVSPVPVVSGVAIVAGSPQPAPSEARAARR